MAGSYNGYNCTSMRLLRGDGRNIWRENNGLALRKMFSLGLLDEILDAAGTKVRAGREQNLWQGEMGQQKDELGVEPDKV